MAIQLRDIVKIKGTSAKGKVVRIRREYSQSGNKIPIYEIKVTSGSMIGKVVQAKRHQLKFT